MLPYDTLADFLKKELGFVFFTLVGRNGDLKKYKIKLWSYVDFPGGLRIVFLTVFDSG